MQSKYLHLVIFFCGLFLLQSPLQAQHLRSQAGDLEVGAQLGLLSIYQIDRATTIVPPLQLQGEFFLSPNFSMGAFVSYVAAKGQRSYVNTAATTITEFYDNQTWATGVRTTAYSNIQADQWRIYGGIAVGAALPRVETTVDVQGDRKGNDLSVPRFSREATNSLLFTGFVGVQYYLRPNVSLNGELGYGLSLMNVGLRYKL
jgi:hypothetical protein